MGASGAAAIVDAIRAHPLEHPSGGIGGPDERVAWASQYRWKAHALHNLAVRSRSMQDAIGDAGGPAVIVDGLRKYAASPRASEAGCKALAYSVNDHRDNCTRALDAGALEAATSTLRMHATDGGAVEAAINMLCLVVGSAGASEAGAAKAAVGCGAHLAALDALQTLFISVGNSAASAHDRGNARDLGGSHEEGSSESTAADTSTALSEHATPPGRPATWHALARSTTWLLAKLVRLVLSEVPMAAMELEARGLRELLASESGVAAQARKKVRDEVEACVALLDASTNSHAEAGRASGDAAAGAKVAVEAKSEPPSTTPAGVTATATPAAAAATVPATTTVVVTATAAATAASCPAPAAEPTGDESISDAISDADLTTCIAVLSTLSADISQLTGSKRFRALRKTLGPIHKAMSVKDESVLAYAPAQPRTQLPVVPRGMPTLPLVPLRPTRLTNAGAPWQIRARTHPAQGGGRKEGASGSA